MTDKNFLRNLKRDLVLIYSELNNINKEDIEVILWGAIYEIDKYLSTGKAVKKRKNIIDAAMIEQRVYPADYHLRAKYILNRIKFHYPNYKISFEYIKATKKQKYMGIPPFEFWAIKKDMDFFALAFQTNMKEFKSIFVDHYLNRLSLSKYAEKHFGDASKVGKKRAENLNNRFCAAFAKALELKDIADAQSNTVKIKNNDFEMYKLLKEINADKKKKS